MLPMMLLFSMTYAQVHETNPDFLRTKHWVFGDSVHLAFEKDTLLGKSLPMDVLAEASSVATSRDGRLLFYVQPETLYDSLGKKLHSLRGGNSSRQGALIIPNQENDSIFYILVNNEGESNLTKYLIVYSYNYLTDNILDVKVIHRNAVEGLAAVNHQNNRNVIIVSHDKSNDEFSFYIISNRGILCCPNKQNIGGDYSKGKFIVYVNGSHLRFNNNGGIFTAASSENNMASVDRTDLYKFSNSYPLLTDNIRINENIINGVSYSLNSRYVYLNNNRIFQYDLSKYDSQSVVKSRTQITPSWNNSLSYSQIGPNGKIFYLYYDSSYLGVINQPDSLGVKCEFKEKGQCLKKKKPNYGLPNFNASYFYTPSIDFAYSEDCWKHSYQFEGRDTLKANKWKWVFQKGNFRDSILTKHCTYQFPDTGKWLVSHIASNSTRTDTIAKTLTITPKWQKDILGRDTFYCVGDSIKLTLKAPPNMHCVHWMGEEPNLDETLGPIVDYNYFHVDTMVVDTAGIYVVKLTNKTFCQTWDTITITEGEIPIKPTISIISQDLASTVTAAKYRWFLNDTFLIETADKSIKPTKNGYYQVKLISEYKCESPLSDSFLYDKISVQNVDLENINIYPNPSNGQITIAFQQPVSCTIEVFDMTGKRVAKQNIQHKIETSLHIKNPGSYVVKVVLDGGVIERVVEVY